MPDLVKGRELVILKGGVFWHWVTDNTSYLARGDRLRVVYHHDHSAPAFPASADGSKESTQFLIYSGDRGTYWDFVPEEKVENTHSRLEQIFNKALVQTRDGKGLERHGSSTEAFEAQPIVTIGRDLGNEGFQLGQALKKVREASRMRSQGKKEAAIAEILGAINYLGAAVILLEDE